MRPLDTRHCRQPISQSAILDAPEVTDVDGPPYFEGNAGRSQGVPDRQDSWHGEEFCRLLRRQSLSELNLPGERAPLAMSFLADTRRVVAVFNSWRYVV